MADVQSREWSLETARAMLDEVRSRTERAVQQADPLNVGRASVAGTPAEAEVEARLRRVVSRWIREMEALGVAVKAPWRVDFDNGSGYYCWRWPEERLEWYRDGPWGRRGNGGSGHHRDGPLAT